ncbi:SDR family oxidoreductase [Bartonella sp. W8125]|uniref:SDR family NAD(P)-dependent oxidoreductase n=1 Tax=Bartonella TaxID=773 RepID=UPI0018DE2216|nr:SDR family NAD(P)-dependent oxidoreductase [Bartonella choladocola]MBI0141151.1 SDR family oxidoreductase [Bartonella choladocola]
MALISEKAMNLHGKVAIVTGAGNGIGLGIARVLAGFGASVALTDREGDSVEAQAEAIRHESGIAQGFYHNVAVTESSLAMVSDVINHFGKIDVLVNGAGISNRSALVDMDDDAWNQIITVNLTGTQKVTRAVLPHLLKQKSGRIINVSSVLGRSGKPFMTHYTASKFGVVGFTQSLALEIASSNITVNALCPGIVKTRAWQIELDELKQKNGWTQEEAWESVMKLIPLGRPQQPEDFGVMAALLASDYGANITGQAYNIDGGYEMH